MQVKMRKGEKDTFPWFARNCIKSAQEHKFTNYYVMLDLKSKKNRLIGSATPSEGCLILAHAQLNFSENGSFDCTVWLAWDFLELKQGLHHEELKELYCYQIW